MFGVGVVDVKVERGRTLSRLALRSSELEGSGGSRESDAEPGVQDSLASGSFKLEASTSTSFKFEQQQYEH